MKEADVKRFLRGRYPMLIELALTYARLTDKERQVVDLCITRGMTQAEVAEELGLDDKTVQRRYRSAVRGMCEKFDDLSWIHKVI